MSEQTAAWNNRIVGHGEEAPEQLLANPRNWRIHPKHQQDALGEALDRIGWVQNVVVNRTTGHVVDGHLRVALSISREEPVVPVTYVELTEEEERLALATLDPLAMEAVTDEGALKGLLADLEGSLPEELEAMLADLTHTYNAPPPEGPSQDEIEAEAERLDGQFKNHAPEDLQTVTCPHCGSDFEVGLSDFQK